MKRQCATVVDHSPFKGSRKILELADAIAARLLKKMEEEGVIRARD